MLELEFEEDIRGRRFARAGELSSWPAHILGPGPEDHITRRGGVFTGKLEEADYLVVGQKRKKGRAALIRRAEKLSAEGGRPQILDERGLLELLRPSLEGRSFFVVGGLTGGVDIEGPAALIEAAGGRVVSADEEHADFAVVGERREKGKTERLRAVERMETAGPVRRLDETLFLDLMALVAGPKDASFDARALTVQLRTVVDPKKVGRAIQMLKKEAFQIFAQADDTSVGGVVKSQTDHEKYYAPWVKEDGSYGCFDDGVLHCWGQQGGLCKHALVLLIGLAVKGTIAPRQAFDLALGTVKKKETEDEEPSAELMLRYRGAQAGEIDWRPTETVPEDFYAL